MGNAAQNTMDVGQLLSSAAKNYAELAGDAALKAGTAAKVITVTITGKTVVFGVVVDITLNDEPVDQALLSQITSAAVGAGFLAVIAPSLPTVLAAGAAAGIAYGADKLVDALYPLVRDNILNKARSLYQSSEAQGSPLILDLDGDGVETTALAHGAYFDHDSNGFAEQTGWVGTDDGLLVRDINGNGTIDNGSELFGNNTILKNGQRAANGFSALADLDDNRDGMIDASDAAYSQLRVWKDANGNGITDSGELLTLVEAGVVGINTAYANSTTVDANANAHKQIGSFTRADGSTATVTDVWFSMDAMYSIPQEQLAETDEIAALPDLQGAGVLHSLHQAMLRDESGTIKLRVAPFGVADGYGYETRWRTV